MRMPFITAERRFIEKGEEVPGPGKYEIKGAVSCQFFFYMNL